MVALSWRSNAVNPFLTKLACWLIMLCLFLPPSAWAASNFKTAAAGPVVQGINVLFLMALGYLFWDVRKRGTLSGKRSRARLLSADIGTVATTCSQARPYGGFSRARLRAGLHDGLRTEAWPQQPQPARITRWCCPPGLVLESRAGRVGLKPSPWSRQWVRAISPKKSSAPFPCGRSNRSANPQ